MHLALPLAVVAPSPEANSKYKDYYAALGSSDASVDEIRKLQARAEEPPGRQQGSEERGEIQGDRRGVPDAQGSRRRLRPARQRYQPGQEIHPRPTGKSSSASSRHRRLLLRRPDLSDIFELLARRARRRRAREDAVPRRGLRGHGPPLAGGRLKGTQVVEPERAGVRRQGRWRVPKTITARIPGRHRQKRLRRGGRA